MADEFEELRKLAEPVRDYIIKKHNPHTAVIITDSYVKVTASIMGMPINKTNSEELAN